MLKNCCLKICENCSLKSVIEIHVFSVYKTKKMCLVSWFKLHVSVFKNIKYVFGMCVLDGKKKLNKVQNKYFLNQQSTKEI